MASSDESSRVPFKWEEAPGKPIPSTHTSPSTPATISFSSPSLQLPPRLQFPLHRPPLSLPHSPCEPPPPWLHQSTPLTVQSTMTPSHSHYKLKRLYTYMLKPGSWSHPHTHPSPCPSWSSSASCSRHNELAMNERFFFDKALPNQFKYSVSMPDSWKARVPIQEEYKQQDVLVDGEAQSSCSAIEQHEAASDAFSPWHPVVFHGRHGSACPQQPKEFGVDEDDDDDDEDEGFHDFFSTASSLEKPSQGSDNSIESASPPSPLPWFLDFSPEEPGDHEGGERSKLVVKLVAIVNIKKIISSKVCKLRKRGADQQASMWSPTLATYLFNEQKEEKEGMCASRKKEVEDDDNDGDESPSMDRSPSSHTFRINSDYHPPSLILRAHLHSDDDSLESEQSSSFRLQFSEDHNGEEKEEEQEQEGLETLRHRLSLREQLAEFNDEYLLQPEGLETLRHKLSLREQLAEFDDEYLLHFVPKDESFTPPILDSQRGEPSPCKGMCKVRNTVKVLVTTIKLILVQTEVKKRKGGQRPSRKYGGCFKPTMGTLSPFPSTHNQALY